MSMVERKAALLEGRRQLAAFGRGVDGRRLHEAVGVHALGERGPVEALDAVGDGLLCGGGHEGSTGRASSP